MSLEVSVNMFFSLEFHCTNRTDFVRVSSIRSGLESYESGLKIIEFGKVLQRLCLKKMQKPCFSQTKNIPENGICHVNVNDFQVENFN